MATRLPASNAPTGEPERAPGCDTSDMLVIHGLFRRVFTDAPRLVRQVAPGDSQRAGVIGAHVREISGGLHNHHHGEDVHLWDELEARSPSCALHVGRMRAQHAGVAELLARLDEAVPSWQAGVDLAAGERVASILDEVREALFTHLGQEEHDILPVASATMSQREWDELGKHGREAIPKNRLLIQLGFILDGFPPSERDAWMKANMPLAARIMYRLVGRRQYESHYRLVYGEGPA
ncbi:MAG: hemerythrin protein [Cryobacterium sp.]|jgi:hypothetical protein|nr:hemerythrin protein [Cryobacterium sp.]